MQVVEQAVGEHQIVARLREPTRRQDVPDQAATPGQSRQPRKGQAGLFQHGLRAVQGVAFGCRIGLEETQHDVRGTAAQVQGLGSVELPRLQLPEEPDE